MRQAAGIVLHDLPLHAAPLAQIGGQQMCLADGMPTISGRSVAKGNLEQVILLER